ncbi:hypothetical protein AB6806_28205 [Bosea sp. RCC_152_1]|uniref:hypothetical protein n=1 Tax=Bosea sp. RCC_152_1 TaxID=3239228 RepID=UPI00352612A9
MSKSKALTDHDEIRRWVEQRGGKPARVEGTEGKDGAGVLRLDFGEPDEGLEPISWDDFFETFEDRGLALLCGTEADSRFNKFIDRE